MPAPKAEHYLYLYQLFATSIGFGKQERLDVFEQSILNDGLVPADFGAQNVEELLATCENFIKLTSFKKGRIFATLLAYPTFDEALAFEESEAQKADVRKGKSWKKKRAVLVPKKPVHKEAPKVATQPEDAPQPAAAPELAAMTKSEPVITDEIHDASIESVLADILNETLEEMGVAPKAHIDTESAPKTEPVLLQEENPAQEPLPAHEPKMAPKTVSVQEPAPTQETVSAQESASAQETVSAQESAPTQETESAQESAPAPEPVPEAPVEPYQTISLQIIDTPEYQDSAQDIEFEPFDELAQNKSKDEDTSASLRSRRGPLILQNPRKRYHTQEYTRIITLPHNITQDVYCPDAQLMQLEELLDPDQNPLAQLDLAWQAYLDDHTFNLSTRRLTFTCPAYKQDSPTVTITIERHAPSGAKKYWRITDVSSL